MICGVRDRRANHATPQAQLLREQSILTTVPRYMLETVIYRLHIVLRTGFLEKEALVGRLIIFVHRADLILELEALRGWYQALGLQIRL